MATQLPPGFEPIALPPGFEPIQKSAIPEQPPEPQPQGGWVNDMESASQGLGGAGLKPVVAALKFLRDHPTLSKIGGTMGALAAAPAVIPAGMGIGGALAITAGMGALGSTAADAASQAAQYGTPEAPQDTSAALGRSGRSTLEGLGTGVLGGGGLAGAPAILRAAASPVGVGAITTGMGLYGGQSPMAAGAEGIAAASGMSIAKMLGNASGSPEVAKILESLGLRRGSRVASAISTAAEPMAKRLERLATWAKLRGNIPRPPLLDVAPMPQSPPLRTPANRLSPSQMMEYQGQLPRQVSRAPLRDVGSMPSAPLQTPARRVGPADQMANQGLLPMLNPPLRPMSGPSPVSSGVPDRGNFQAPNLADQEMEALRQQINAQFKNDPRMRQILLAELEKSGGVPPAQVPPAAPPQAPPTAPPVAPLPAAEASPELQAGYREALMMEPGLSYGQRTTPQVASPELQSIINDIPGPTLPPPPPPGSIPKGQHTLPNNYQGTGGGPPMKSIGMNSAQETADELMLLNILKSGGKLSRQETISKMKAAGASESAISAVMRNFKGSIQ